MLDTGIHRNNIAPTGSVATIKRHPFAPYLLDNITSSLLWLQDSYINNSCATALPLLFPKLRDASGGVIVFDSCTIYSKFMCISAPQVQLSSLSLHHCSFQGASVAEALACLGEVRSLKELSVSLKWAGNLPVSCLSKLKLLESLSLERCTPVGLGHVLQSIPSLRELSLDT